VHTYHTDAAAVAATRCPVAALPVSSAAAAEQPGEMLMLAARAMRQSATLHDRMIINLRHDGAASASDVRLRMKSSLVASDSFTIQVNLYICHVMTYNK